MLTPGMATSMSLSEGLYRSPLTFPNALHSQRSGGCGYIAYKPSPAYLRRNRVQTSRHAAYDLRSQARQRPVPVSATVAEQDLADDPSEREEDTSQVQPFLEWLAIQGCAHDGQSYDVVACLRFMFIWLSGITGVEDLQEENCNLGVYKAEKGERGILSLQVSRHYLLSC